MNEQIQNILNENGTKTSKIQKLLSLGLTRRQVADLVANGNYGFVQNVYKRMMQGITQNRTQRKQRQQFFHNSTTLSTATSVSRLKLTTAHVNASQENLPQQASELTLSVTTTTTTTTIGSWLPTAAFQATTPSNSLAQSSTESKDLRNLRKSAGSSTSATLRLTTLADFTFTWTLLNSTFRLGRTL